MCSFLFTRTAMELSDSVVESANRFARYRGPDRTTVRRFVEPCGRHLTFVHNLLDMSGSSSVQPVVEGDGDQLQVVLFNGEIYNFHEFGQFDADTECLLPAYRNHGDLMAKELDGEFAVVIYDAKRESVLVFGDPFLTKPIFLGSHPVNGDFGVATCASSLRAAGLDQIVMAEPNCCYSIKLHSFGQEIVKLDGSFEFSLHQNVDHFDEWSEAFLCAVRKRAVHGAHRPVVFLSSGYDSGAICLALNLQGIQYDTFSIEAGEDQNVLNRRIRLNRAASCGTAFRFPGLSSDDVRSMAEDIQLHVESFSYQHEDQPGHTSTLHSDGGALGANFLSQQARKNLRLVNLSGSGADEILSDYGFAGEKFYYHSQFGGLFPADLRAVFPWKKFYGDTQRSYLFKDEYILGRHGLEGRYPFLDRQLVQAFLSLSMELKNSTYKAPLSHFLTKHNYPFEPMKKRGFAPKAEPRSYFSQLVGRWKR